jgi:uncharacterized membrane protein YcaP (DUF421 family)
VKIARMEADGAISVIRNREDASATEGGRAKAKMAVGP